MQSKSSCCTCNWTKPLMKHSLWDQRSKLSHIRHVDMEDMLKNTGNKSIAIQIAFRCTRLVCLHVYTDDCTCAKLCMWRNCSPKDEKSVFNIYSHSNQEDFLCSLQTSSHGIRPKYKSPSIILVHPVKKYSLTWIRR